MNFVHYSYREFPHQQYRLVNSIPHDVLMIIIKHGMILAGGSITSVFTNSDIKDFDLYPTNYSNYLQFSKELCELIESSAESNDRKLFMSDNAETYSYGGAIIQVIRKFVDKNNSDTVFTSEDILNTFDFTCCMGCYDLRNQEFVLHKNFLVDLAGKNLVYNSENPKYPICALYRILKYEKKGFSISAGELVKLAICVCKLEMNTYQDLKEQLLGIDTQIFEEITTDLIDKNGESSKIDYGVVIDLINEKLNSLWDSEQYINLIESNEGII